MVTLHANDARAHLARRVTELHVELARRPPAQLAAAAGASIENGRFQLTLWQQPIFMTPPDFLGRGVEDDEPLDVFQQALLAYYLVQADGTPLTGEWTAFSELPGAQFYATAFQGYTGYVLAKRYGNDLEAMAETAAALGGRSVPFAERAFTFPVLPFVAVLVAAWQGDEDFPPSYRILFDANTRHHLPTDACAIVGSTLTRRMIAG